MQEINMTICMVNTEENSYNSHVILKYPFGLSYRRFTSEKASMANTQTLIVSTCFLSSTLMLWCGWLGTITDTTSRKHMYTVSLYSNSNSSNSAPIGWLERTSWIKAVLWRSRRRWSNPETKVPKLRTRVQWTMATGVTDQCSMLCLGGLNRVREVREWTVIDWNTNLIHDTGDKKKNDRE